MTALDILKKISTSKGCPTLTQELENTANGDLLKTLNLLRSLDFITGEDGAYLQTAKAKSFLTTLSVLEEY